ncbi:MAG: hypothetical protein U0361_03385 [Nitrospiraceae bacterium]
MNALAVAALQTTAIAGLSNSTFQDYYSAAAGSFGSTLQDARQESAAQEILISVAGSPSCECREIVAG